MNAAAALDDEEDTEDRALLSSILEELEAEEDEFEEEEQIIHSNMIDVDIDEDAEEDSSKTLEQVEKQFFVGDKVMGRISLIQPRSVRVDIGGKVDAQCAAAELTVAGTRRVCMADKCSNDVASALRGLLLQTEALAMMPDDSFRLVVFISFFDCNPSSCCAQLLGKSVQVLQ